MTSAAASQSAAASHSSASQSSTVAAESPVAPLASYTAALAAKSIVSTTITTSLGSALPRGLGAVRKSVSASVTIPTTQSLPATPAEHSDA